MDDMELTVDDVALMLKCHPEHVRRLCRRHVLGHRKPGKRYYISAADVDAYLRGEKAGRLAVEWLALVPADRSAKTVARLLHKTFGLDAVVIAEVLVKHGMTGVEEAVRSLEAR